MLHIALALLAMALVVGGVLAVNAVRTSLTAEHNLQAFSHAQRATLAYIQQHNGKWPATWDDLRAVRPEADFDSVAKRVNFDFQADPRIVATQSPGSFTAIQRNSPCYPIDDQIQQVIDSLKRYHGPAGSAPSNRVEFPEAGGAP